MLNDAKLELKSDTNGSEVLLIQFFVEQHFSDGSFLSLFKSAVLNLSLPYFVTNRTFHLILHMPTFGKKVLPSLRIYWDRPKTVHKIMPFIACTQYKPVPFGLSQQRSHFDHKINSCFKQTVQFSRHDGYSRRTSRSQLSRIYYVVDQRTS